MRRQSSTPRSICRARCVRQRSPHAGRRTRPTAAIPRPCRTRRALAGARKSAVGDAPRGGGGTDRTQPGADLSEGELTACALAGRLSVREVRSLTTVHTAAEMRSRGAPPRVPGGRSGPKWDRAPRVVTHQTYEIRAPNSPVAACRFTVAHRTAPTATATHQPTRPLPPGHQPTRPRTPQIRLSMSPEVGQLIRLPRGQSAWACHS